MMCACGEPHPSYVCSRHAGTREDWRTHHDEPLTREEELDRAYGQHGTLRIGLKGENTK